MSFNRLNYDLCTYKQNLNQSIGPGSYVAGTPRMDCQACFVPDPQIRQNASTTAMCIDKSLIDLDSELIGINRKASNCPLDHYMPSDKAYCNVAPLKECKTVPVEDTRLSNPPCTLRCTGWNRWEWLCQNPQDKALIGFDYNISNRLVVKDNHRPCVPTPINQASALPAWNASDDQVAYDPDTMTNGAFNQLNGIPSTSWRKLDSYKNYF